MQTETDYLHTLVVSAHSPKDIFGLSRVDEIDRAEVLRNQSSSQSDRILPDNEETLNEINQKLNGSFSIVSAEYLNETNDLMRLVLNISNPEANQIEVAITKRRMDGLCDVNGTSSASAHDGCVPRQDESLFTTYEALFGTLIAVSSAGLVVGGVVLTILGVKYCSKK